ncbi:MAG TPA: CorA family divalent cation transporter [Candidatus Paceibacterota bacterium]|nr:CorA family divalent cation transporter [Candidatus Paceibacterota bacterium]
MVLRHVRGGITWIDIESPDQTELETILHEFEIDPRIEDEIISPTPYPLFIPFTDYVYMVLHFPTALPEGGTKNQEMDFIVGKDFIITARYEVIDPIHNLHKVFEAEELLGLPNDSVKPATLLERIFRRLYGALGQEVENAARQLEHIERDIFSGRERATVRSISQVGRLLLRFDTTLTRHAEPLSAFIDELSETRFFGKSFSEHGAHIKAEREHAVNLIASYRAVATELRDTNDSLLSTSQNEVMKTLTVVTFIVFPLSLVAALFQMNVPGAPLMENPHAFWIVIGIMVCLSALLAWFTIQRKWL